MSKSKQTPYHVKLDRDVLTKAQGLIDVPAAIRQLLDRIVGQRRCPTCGQCIKTK